MRELYEKAMSMAGTLKEVPGAGSNPEIVAMFKKVLGRELPDSTAWCAVAVGSILIDCGYASTASALARSYLDYGAIIRPQDAEPGDIVIFWRDKPTSWKGHVGIFARRARCGKILVYGGNQDNEFKLKAYSEDQLLGVRRPTASDRINRPLPPVQEPDEIDYEDLDFSDFPRPLWYGQDIFGDLEAKKREIISELVSLEPSDVKEYCSTYSGMNSVARIAFWEFFLSCLAQVESSLNTHTKYTESFNDSQGRRVISRGLFQLSVESVNGYVKYGAPKVTADDLHDPIINLRCAVVILSRWISKDHVIAGDRPSDHRGGSRYWSTLRRNTKHDFIISKCEDAWG